MKLHIYTGIIFLMLFGFSCRKDKLAEFTLRFTSQATIPGSTPVSLPFEILTPPVTTNTQAELEGRNSNLSLINFVKLSSLEIEITNPPGKKFSFLKDVYIYINADGLGEKLVAQKTNIPNDAGSVIALETSDENLKDYLKKDKFSLRLKAVTDESMTSSTDLELRSAFQINAGVDR